MRGRITEEHLELAEQSFPGISEVYLAMARKPATFLHLLWIYQDLAGTAEWLSELERTN